MKAIIPAAGLGTRMLPATKSIPKEMLTVVDRPLIQHIIDEIADAEINEVILVSHQSKTAIEKYFVTDQHLAGSLEAANKNALLDEIKNIAPEEMAISIVYQDKPLGLGHAISCAKQEAGDDDIAVILPDVLIDKNNCAEKPVNLKEMVRSFRKHNTNQILVEQVPEELVSNYGIVDIQQNDIGAGESARISNIVEKPDRENAPSNLAVVGRYVLSKSIWQLLENVQPGAGGEIQLTDAIDALKEHEPVDAYNIEGASHDCGSKLGLIKANIHFSLQDPKFKTDVNDYLKRILNN
ncbi:UTP--glucose-1-phosphate uridylyltransferase [Vibrio parahaemolyticus]|nr:UTP--glucose-1-phosphate uridylyltransferase [Vibrio parahaemolyticus]